jgi:hypothetical protein
MGARYRAIAAIMEAASTSEMSVNFYLATTSQKTAIFMIFQHAMLTLLNLQLCLQMNQTE